MGLIDYKEIDGLFDNVLNDTESIHSGLRLMYDTLSKNVANRKTFDDTYASYRQHHEEIAALVDQVEVHTRSLMMLGTATDKSISDAIEKITMVINQALLVMFPKDVRTVRIRDYLYQNRYLHFEVVLENGRGKKRSFKMSGTGLAQIVSNLFTIAYVDISGGRKVLVLDEIFNGLHPKAKLLMRELLMALKDYQFIIVEHGIDIGKQYEAIMQGERSFLRYNPSGNHYSDTILKSRGIMVEDEQEDLYFDENGMPIKLSQTDIPENPLGLQK